MAYSTRVQRRRRHRRRRKVRLPYLTLLAWLGVFAAGYASLTPGPIAVTESSQGEKLRLCMWARQDNCVVDGDTIRYGGSTVRLLDIDAPETYEPRCASEAELGRRAANRLLELVNDGPFEVVGIGGRDEDVYGRKLRRLERDGRSLGDTLVAEGLARRWDGARRTWC